MLFLKVPDCLEVASLKFQVLRMSGRPSGMPDMRHQDGGGGGHHDDGVGDGGEEK